MNEPPHPPGARRAVLIGAGIFIVGALFVFSPLFLGRGSLNRYIVSVGLACVFIGGSAAFHGAWDWLRERRR
jgi:hypothetical protein